MNKKIIITICIFLILIFGISALEITITNISLENKNALLRVGSGIGTIQKERMLFDEEGINYTNETYIDELKMLEQGCDGDYCYFKLFEEGGINKEFKVMLEKICAKEGICKEEGEEYECCLEWRDETDEEVLAKAETKSEEILNNIASVTLDREAGSKAKRFEDIEVLI